MDVRTNDGALSNDPADALFLERSSYTDERSERSYFTEEDARKDTSAYSAKVTAVRFTLTCTIVDSDVNDGGCSLFGDGDDSWSSRALFWKVVVSSTRA